MTSNQTCETCKKRIYPECTSAHDHGTPPTLYLNGETNACQCTVYNLYIEAQKEWLNCWSAVVLNLPGACGQAETKEEAILHAIEGAKACIEVYLEDGKGIPFVKVQQENPRAEWRVLRC